MENIQIFLKVFKGAYFQGKGKNWFELFCDQEMEDYWNVREEYSENMNELKKQSKWLTTKKFLYEHMNYRESAQLSTLFRYLIYQSLNFHQFSQHHR